MKRSLILLACLFLFALSTIAQSTRSVVKLKNGVVLRGEIVEYSQDEYLIMRIVDGQDMRISADHIRSFKIKNGEFRAYNVPEKGYFNFTSAGLLFLKGNRYDAVEANLSFQTINGYRLNEKYYAGIGVGLDRYGSLTALPVYLSLRTDLLDSKVSPVFNANVGYGWMWESSVYNEWDDYDSVVGGFYWDLGGGIRINYKKTALLFNLVYKHQDSEISISNEFSWRAEETVVEHHKFRNMAFTIGMEF